MKNKLRWIFLQLIVGLASGATLYAQDTPREDAQMQRANIVPIEEHQYTHNFYAGEILYWSERLKSHPSDERAWLNYYKASRYLNYTEHSRSISKQHQLELDRILNQMREKIPATFGLEYAEYLNGNKSILAFEHLVNAYERNTNFPEIWDDMLCKAIIDKDEVAAKKFAKLLSESGIYSAAQIMYNRNVLSSIEKNGVLVTHGHVDTYPILLMQLLQGYRTDVKVICLDWLENSNYSATIAQWFGLKSNRKINLNDLLQQSKNNSIYIGLTLPAETIARYASQLFCTGLVLKYSNTPLDNLPVLASNWEMRFDKSIIENQEEINRNYILPLVLLKSYYEQEKKTDLQQEVITYFEALTKQFGLTKVYQNHKD